MFTKLFSSITTSSIWNEDSGTRIVWITMLALANKQGYVSASVGGLAHEARVSKEVCEAALKILSSPDEDSRSKEFEGRRIEVVDGGFQLLNYEKYRAMRSEEERREYMKTYMVEYRRTKNVSKNVNNVSECKPPLAAVSHSKPPLAKAEAEAEEMQKRDPEGVVLRERIGKLFRRRASTPWERCELAKLKELRGRPDLLGELFEMEAYYASPCEFLRRDLITLLNNWTGELDRARAPYRGPFVQMAKNAGPGGIAVNSVFQADSVIKDALEAIKAIKNDPSSKERRLSEHQVPTDYLTQDAKNSIAKLEQKIKETKDLKLKLQ